MSNPNEILQPRFAHPEKYSRIYLAFRRTVGWIGILLPVVLALGNALVFHEYPLLHSISRYYFSGMRDVFVGCMGAMALFLFFSSGLDRWENLMGKLAGCCAAGVAIFSVAPLGEPWDTSATIHYICAFGLFIILGLDLLLLISRNWGDTSERARRRSWFHRFCGIVIIGSVVAVCVYSAVSENSDNPESLFTLIAETIALVAFGSSWLIECRNIKLNLSHYESSSILADSPDPPVYC